MTTSIKPLGTHRCCVQHRPPKFFRAAVGEYFCSCGAALIENPACKCGDDIPDDTTGACPSCGTIYQSIWNVLLLRLPESARNILPAIWKWFAKRPILAFLCTTMFFLVVIGWPLVTFFFAHSLFLDFIHGVLWVMIRVLSIALITLLLLLLRREVMIQRWGLRITPTKYQEAWNWLRESLSKLFTRKKSGNATSKPGKAVKNRPDAGLNAWDESLRRNEHLWR